MAMKLQPNSLLQQQIKGRYLPTSLNYRGDIALTFSAIDQQNQRPVILKYYQQHENRNIQDAIQRGVMLHAQLRSDHIVPLIDFGVHGQYGGVWCVLSREESPNLVRHVKSQGSLDSHETCEILISLCDALISLHNEDKVHGNLKPSNVFIKVRQGQGISALISDILGPGLCGVHKTDIGRVTYNDPTYFTYEQASGKTITAQTDVGALGLLGYFMLTGNPPFTGRTTDKLLTAVIIGSGRVKVNKDDIKGTDRQREQVARIINECLSKQAASRPKDLAQLKVALEEAHKLVNHKAQPVAAGSGLDALNSLGSVGTQTLNMPSLTPNHSLMNTLGFGQTLGFDAITEQTLNQYSNESISSSVASLSSSTTSGLTNTDGPAPLSHILTPTSNRMTGSQKAIITAPPEGFEAPDIAGDTLVSSPKLDGGKTMMGGISFDEIKELQGMPIVDESTPQLTELGGLSTPAPVSTIMGHAIADDTRPLTPEELKLVGAVSATSTGSNEWGDLSQWSGFEEAKPDPLNLIENEEQTNPNINLAELESEALKHYQLSPDTNLDVIGVDELELDLLLEQAAHALVEDDTQKIDTSMLQENHLHHLDEQQRSTLFGQLINDQEMNSLTESNESTIQNIDVENNLEQTAQVDLQEILAQAAYELDQERSSEDSLTARYKAATSHQMDPRVSANISIDDSFDSGLIEELSVPELFSSPAQGVLPERPTLDSDETDRLNIPDEIVNFDLGDFVMMEQNQSGAFALEQVHQDRGGSAVIQKKHPQVSHGQLPPNKMEHRELDTQLEYQRPEEIFPDVPEWQSLVALKDKPLELSQALLSIPLPLSGQLLPFSQFQLEIEGREHEEGFFVRSQKQVPHIPVVLEPQDIIEAEVISNGIWEDVSSVPSGPPSINSKGPRKASSISKKDKAKVKNNTLLNIALLIFALVIMIAGLFLGSGMTVDEVLILINGESPPAQYQYKAIDQPMTPQINRLQPTQIVEKNAGTNLEKAKLDGQVQINSSDNQPVKPQIKTQRKSNKAIVDREKGSKGKTKSLKKSRKKVVETSSKKAKKKRTKRKKRKKKSTIKDPFAL